LTAASSLVRGLAFSFCKSTAAAVLRIISFMILLSARSSASSGGGPPALAAHLAKASAIPFPDQSS
jgi:hypothetical protein